MVTVAEATDQLYPVDNNKPIARKGFVHGNFGEFNRHWLNVTDGDEIPSCGVIRTTGASGEDTVNMWGANSELGYGVLGHDRTQLASTWTSSVVYAATDIAPVYPFAENPGMIFQGVWRVLPQGGELLQSDQGDALIVREATAVTLIMAGATNYRLTYPDYKGDPPGQRNERTLKAMADTSFSMNLRTN